MTIEEWAEKTFLPWSMTHDGVWALRTKDVKVVATVHELPVGCERALYRACTWADPYRLPSFRADCMTLEKAKEIAIADLCQQYKATPSATEAKHDVDQPEWRDYHCGMWTLQTGDKLSAQIDQTEDGAFRAQVWYDWLDVTVHQKISQFETLDAAKLYCESELAARASQDSKPPQASAEAKHDAGKLPWHLAPWAQLESVVAVYRFGAGKYGENTWQTVPNARERYFSAIMRHLSAWWQGETNDAESGLPHLAHAAWGCLALMWLDSKQ